MGHRSRPVGPVVQMVFLVCSQPLLAHGRLWSPLQDEKEHDDCIRRVP